MNPKTDEAVTKFHQEAKTMALARKAEISKKIAAEYRSGTMNMMLAAAAILLTYGGGAAGIERFQELIPQTDRVHYFDQMKPKAAQVESFKTLFLGDVESGVAS